MTKWEKDWERELREFSDSRVGRSRAAVGDMVIFDEGYLQRSRETNLEKMGKCLFSPGFFWGEGEGFYGT